MSDMIAKRQSGTSGRVAAAPDGHRPMMPIDSVIDDLVRYLAEAAAAETDPLRAERIGRARAQILDCRACNRAQSSGRCDLCGRLEPAPSR